jgi:hypothetical protein
MNDCLSFCFGTVKKHEMKIKFLLLFWVLCQSLAWAQPTITTFTPSGGPVGTLVTINGTGLNNPTVFTIGGKTAIVISNTGTVLVGLVMPGAVTGAVSVSTAGGSATASGAAGARCAFAFDFGAPL